jgi:hypothetical protein
MKKKLVLFLVILLLFPLALLAQSGQKMILRFIAEGTMQAMGIYGPAGVTIKAEGYAYLAPGTQGKFTGKGDISVTMDFNYQKTGYVSISQLKGYGQVEVVGKKEGKFLRFYFKPGSIPCKGEIIVNYPPPMGTQKEPYEDQFNPQVIAPEGNPEAKIEWRNSAGAELSYGPESYAGGAQNASWKSEFTIHNLEHWKIDVKGEETDSLQPPIKNPKLKTQSKELPVAGKFEWELTGEFYIIGVEGARQYHEGHIVSSVISSGVVFDFNDLYRPQELPGPENWDTEGTIGGKMIGMGNTVQLQWPKFIAKSSFSFVPQLSYLGQERPRREFKSGDFMGYLSSEKLPLLDGLSSTMEVSDWLKYRITLKKIK